MKSTDLYIPEKGVIILFRFIANFLLYLYNFISSSDDFIFLTNKLL